MKFHLAILLFLSQAGFNSCQKKYDSTGTQSLKIDSITYVDNTGIKFSYDNARIGFLNKYIYPDNQAVNKIVYSYTGNKITEKLRVSLISGNTIWKTVYTYSPTGKLSSIQLLLPTGTPGVYKIHSRFNINYSGDVIVSSEFLEYIFDTTRPSSRYGYKYELSNANIVRSVPDSATFSTNSYTYSNTNKQNIFLNDDFFIKDYQALNLDNTGLNFSVILPFFINKNETELITTEGQSVRYSFKSVRDNSGRAISASIYDYNGFNPFVTREWNFFYK